METARNGRRGCPAEPVGKSVSNAAGTSAVALKFTDSTGTKAGKMGKSCQQKEINYLKTVGQHPWQKRTSHAHGP